jgi:hypothetical protein
VEELRASRDIKEGEELTDAYLDLTAEVGRGSTAEVGRGGGGGVESQQGHPGGGGAYL